MFSVSVCSYDLSATDVTGRSSAHFPSLLLWVDKILYYVMKDSSTSFHQNYTEQSHLGYDMTSTFCLNKVSVLTLLLTCLWRDLTDDLVSSYNDKTLQSSPVNIIDQKTASVEDYTDRSQDHTWHCAENCIWQHNIHTTNNFNFTHNTIYNMFTVRS